MTTIFRRSFPSIPALDLVLLFLSALVASLHAFTLDQPAGSARISHSGPTNALYGHETLVGDDGHSRDKRGVFWPNANGWGGGWQNGAGWNGGGGGLLVSSEPPNNYLKVFLVGISFLLI